MIADVLSPVLSVDLPWGLIVALKTLIVLQIIPFGALLLGYVLLLKMMSHMQARMGPMYPGGFHGWAQSLADGIKFVLKENIIPNKADKSVFAVVPYVILMSTFLIYVVIPAGPSLVIENLEVGVFYVLAALLSASSAC